MVCKLYYRKAGSGDGVWEVRGRKRREKGKEREGEREFIRF